MTTAYAKERRRVFRQLAQYLEEALVQNYEWLEENEDDDGLLNDATYRRRVKAARALKDEFEKKGREP